MWSRPAPRPVARVVHTQEEMNAAVSAGVTRLDIQETDGECLTVDRVGVSVVVCNGGVAAFSRRASGFIGLDGIGHVHQDSWVVALNGGVAFVELAGRAVVHRGGIAVVHYGGFATVQFGGWAQITNGGAGLVYQGGEARVCAGGYADVRDLHDVIAHPDSVINLIT